MKKKENLGLPFLFLDINSCRRKLISTIKYIHQLKKIIMGLFNLFKTPEQRKLDERVNTIVKAIFPGGKKQQEQEIQEVRQLLGFRYTREAVEYAFVFASISYHTSENPKTEEIVDAVLRNSKTSVSREDAEKICLFVECKRYYKPTSSLATTLQQKSDGEKLFMVAFGGIVEIKRAYKDLTNFGKFEVILFNSVVAFLEYEFIRTTQMS